MGNLHYRVFVVLHLNGADVSIQHVGYVHFAIAYVNAANENRNVTEARRDARDSCPTIHAPPMKSEACTCNKANRAHLAVSSRSVQGCALLLLNCLACLPDPMEIVR